MRSLLLVPIVFSMVQVTLAAPVDLVNRSPLPLIDGALHGIFGGLLEGGGLLGALLGPPDSG